jgi:hypothetical protein
LYCPYCYQRFIEREIQFRCSGRTPPAGQPCRTKLDKVLSQVMGDGEPKYPVFGKDGRKPQAECPQCGVSTSYRICPRCHMQLPVHFGKVDARMIALIGAKESGKTIYMTVLLHEMMNRLSRRFSASVLGADDETRTRYHADYEKSLYEQRSLPETTRTAKAGPGRRPLVFSFAIDRTRLGRTGVRRSVLSFFDTAGEDLQSEQSVELNTRYLSSADGIILLLDPLQMRGARPLVNDDAELPPEATHNDLPEHVLGRVIDLLERSLKMSGRGKIGKPIAVAFSKMDTLTGALPEDSPLLEDPGEEPWFDEIDSLAVHRHIQELLQKWQGGNLDRTLGVHFGRYRFFGLSALGNSPVTESDSGPRRVSHHGVQPVRVADPFLWLMSEFGAIPQKTGRRRV